MYTVYSGCLYAGCYRACTLYIADVCMQDATERVHLYIADVCMQDATEHVHRI